MILWTVQTVNEEMYELVVFGHKNEVRILTAFYKVKNQDMTYSSRSELYSRLQLGVLQVYD